MEKRKAYAYYEERSGRELQVEMGKRLNFPSYNIVTVIGTAASRVYFHLKAEAVRM